MPYQATPGYVPRRYERTLQARGHWFEPSCAHQVRNLFRNVTLVAKRKRRAKELAAGGSGDVRAGRQACAELRVGKGAATTESVELRVIPARGRRRSIPIVGGRRAASVT